MRRWAIYIDIEGFSAIYATDEVRAICGLGAIMEGIYRIGTTVCADAPNRLFVHQTGDGFAIVSEFAQRGPELPTAIAAVLMRLALSAGCLTKAGISEGEFADIRGCYPDVIRDRSNGDGVVRLGHGVMRIFPVMGTALINAHHLTTRAKGSLLLLDPTMAPHLSTDDIVSARFSEFVAIDWVHAEIPEIREIVGTASIAIGNTPDLEQLLRTAVAAARNSVSAEWVANSLTYNRCG